MEIVSNFPRIVKVSFHKSGAWRLEITRKRTVADDVRRRNGLPRGLKHPPHHVVGYGSYSDGFLCSRHFNWDL